MLPHTKTVSLIKAWRYLVIWFNTQLENHFVIVFYSPSNDEQFGFNKYV